MPPSNLREGRGVKILQGYIITDPGELRLRKKGEEYFLTVKGDGTLSRDEWEHEIPEWVFQTLWPQTEGRRIEKSRYSVEWEGNTLELDEYYGNLTGLFTLEVEFLSEEDAAGFVPPWWCGQVRDVTEDKRYKNKALAVNGLPR